ncbi:MAG: SpoIID/LytB domain-containing protein [Planctomycetes bacterium]|nr:SpoIID/LytB domain-containing protein [Planctomycetota bacterium]
MKYTLILIFVLAGISLGGCLRRDDASGAGPAGVDGPFHVRVLLLAGAGSCDLTVEGGFEIITSDMAGAIELYSQSGPVKITIIDGRWTLLGRVISSQNITIVPRGKAVFSLNGESFRGVLHLIAKTGRKSFDAINSLPMEAYLNGVVSAEMPYYWEQQALQAQAIAARTYCWFIKNTFGSGRDWDVRKTQASQMYKGIVAETARTREAVAKTAGKILICKQDDGSMKPFPAYYSSTCGGHTEDSKNVFGDSYPPLGGVDCPYCLDSVKVSLLFWPMVQFDKKTVNRRIFKRYPNLKKLKSIEKIIVTGQSDYGKFKRITMVKLVGSNGKEGFLRGEDLRLSIDPTGARIKSAACRIILIGNEWTFVAGRGYGHGVGMCQYGALKMARNGKSAKEILRYYYPGSKIKKLY